MNSSRCLVILALWLSLHAVKSACKSAPGPLMLVTVYWEAESISSFAHPVVANSVSPSTLFLIQECLNVGFQMISVWLFCLIVHWLSCWFVWRWYVPSGNDCCISGWFIEIRSICFLESKFHLHKNMIQIYEIWLSIDIDLNRSDTCGLRSDIHISVAVYGDIQWRSCK